MVETRLKIRRVSSIELIYQPGFFTYTVDMKKLPLGIQTFRKIIENNYFYVDKTKEILNLIKSGEIFFLSRPRRFGKSLLVSTLKEIFSGSRDLFKDLYIYDKIEWKKHPVIHIDFSIVDYNTPEELSRSLLIRLRDINKKYDLSVEEDLLKIYFEKIINALAEKFGSKVVVLIDEYDKPIIDFITDLEKAKANREILRGFYSVLKGVDEYLQFVFLTGVSKFSKVSVFSGLNNIFDITLDNRFSTLLGITEEELRDSFKGYIETQCSIENLSQESLLQDIKYWYNGYSWDGINKVYNPTSLLHLFYNNQFDNYWFTTATPTFLIKTMEKYDYEITDIEETRVGKFILDSYDIDEMDVNALLFQTGYLTVKKVVRVGREYLYTLGCPNYEVKDSLLNYIISKYIKEPVSKIKPQYIMMLEALMNKNLERFISIIRAMFAKIPYYLRPRKDVSVLPKVEDKAPFYHEAYYHSFFYLILALLGVKINLEVLTDKGRMDGVLELENQIYVIELKRGTAQEAIDQINDKKYYEPYLDSKKEIFLLGIGGFDDKDIQYICRQIKN